MVARPGTYQASFNAGELGDEIQGNTGLKQFYVGAARMQNAEPVPQGGFDQTPGTVFRGLVRRALTSVWTHGAATSAASAVAATLLTYPFGATLDVAAVDIAGLSASVAQSADILAVEIQKPDMSWVLVGGALPLPLAASAATRRLGFSPGAAVPATAIRLRLNANPSAAMTLSVTSLTVWTEAATGVPAVKLAPFTVDRSAAYLAVFTAGHVDLWKSGAGAWTFAGCAANPYGAADLPLLKPVQRRETMEIFRADVQTQRLLRHGADWKWSLSPQSFVNIPQVDYGGAYVAVAEVWNLYLSWSGITIQGQTFNVSVDGEATDEVLIATNAGAPDWTATAANLVAALVNLAAIEPGVTVTVGTTSGSTATLVIAFTGTLNAGNRFALGGQFLSSTQGAITLSRKTKGVPGGEDAISATRGWAATGLFYQDRLWHGGMAAKGSAFMGSRIGEYFDLNTGLETASGAVLFNIDTEGGDAIVQLAEGRHLVIFTDAANYYLPNRVASASEVLAPVKNTSDGASARVPVVEQEGGLLFVNSEETIVFSTKYDEVAQGYVPDPISLLSSHLIAGLRDAALLRANVATDADRYILIRDDGLAVVALLIRNQDVSAFTRRLTDGAFRAVATVNRRDVWLAVERQVGGQATLMVETLESGQLFDAAIHQTSGVAQTTWTGLGIHEGATVWALADGYEVGPFVVSGGAITLPFAATDVTVGRWTPFVVTTMPPSRDIGDRKVLKRPGRIATVKADVIATTSLAIGANGGAPKDVPLLRGGGAVDAPVAPVTGQIVVTGLQGWSDDPQVTFTQVRPGRCQIRNITLEARL